MSAFGGPPAPLPVSWGIPAQWSVHAQWYCVTPQLRRCRSRRRRSSKSSVAAEVGGVGTDPAGTDGCCWPNGSVSATRRLTARFEVEAECEGCCCSWVCAADDDDDDPNG